jgi:hypothetical protein
MLNFECMKNILFLFICSFLTLPCIGQKAKPFCGKLTYTINIADTSLSKYFPEKKMFIHTNDSLLRIENHTEEFGMQILIKHMIKNKSYLLLSLDKGNFAIQTNHDAQNIDSSLYTISRKMGKKKICGLKAKKLMVNHPSFENQTEFYYLPKYAPKYLNAYYEFPGLPVLYYLNSEYGLLKYELIDIQDEIPNYDLFGIPSDYKKITFDEFVQEMIKVE